MEWLYKGSFGYSFIGGSLSMLRDLQIRRNLGNAVHDAALASILRDHEAMDVLRGMGLSNRMQIVITADDPADAILNSRA